MSTFAEYPYQRPDLQRLTTDFEAALADFAEAPDAAAQGAAFERLNALRTDFDTMYNICYIRHTQDTRDAFYTAENEWFDGARPSYEALNNRLYRALLAAEFRPELETTYGAQLFVIAELSLKTFQPAILNDLEEENALASAYVKLKASARIEYAGESYNLSSIHPLTLSPDRAVRRAASVAKWNFYVEQSPEIERIYDEQVRVRTRIARELGYASYVPLGYARLLRSDYDAGRVAAFRAQVREHIVPVAQALYERQRRRLGLDTLYFYDEDFRFASGNAKPQGDPDWIVAQAARMYRELAPETNTFFGHLQQHGLMDLVNRDGKATGGYCTFVAAHRSPYIFSNFNGTSGDIDVLTHEAGHAFQVYESRDMPVGEYNWPTYEACEIHSMSMEFFTWPWMQLFFGEQTEKYKFAHLAGALKFIPYGVAVDEFQHRVYARPDMSPAERNAVWRELEAIYLPHRNYDGVAFLERGGFWQRQSHVFTTPFYYIDYTLAQLCAFQFWKRDRADHAGAWADYLRLCRAGGSRSFLELVELAGLRSPFAPGTIASVIGDIRRYLDGVDDTKF